MKHNHVNTKQKENLKRDNRKKGEKIKIKCRKIKKVEN